MVTARVLVVASLLASTGLLAEESSGPSFQLVSIRKVLAAPCPPQELCIGAAGPSRNPSSIGALAGGRFEARNQSLENLVRVAYGFEQIDPRHGMVDGGGLRSARVARFDITAVSDREWTTPPAGEQLPAEVRTMLRALLENRFKLKARLETKKVDVAALRLVGTEPGPGLRPAARDCLGPFTDPPADRRVSACDFHADWSRIEAGSMTIPEVAKLLLSVPGVTQRAAIVDQTGLRGRYDVALNIGGSTSFSRMIVNAESDAQGALTSSVVTQDRRPIAVLDALKKQLGLKLVNIKAEIPTLKIEHAENPQED